MNGAQLIDSSESLIRVRATRRGSPIDLCVHYEVTRQNGCDTYMILSIDEVE